MKYENLILYDMLHMEVITNTSEKVLIADEIFSILKKAYADVKGGLHFQNPDELVCKTSQWKVIYYETSIVGVVVYKAKKGLKMVALAVSDLHSSIRKHTKTMLSYIFRLTFNTTWMEVSEGVEKFIVKNGGEKYFISNKLAHKLTGKEIVELCGDGYHYIRVINGVLKTKVIVGNPKIKGEIV